MSNSKLLIFSVFPFFSFLISFTSSSYLNTNLTTITTTTTHQCSAQQTLALLLFKQNLSSINDTSGYCQYPVMMNWNTSTDCCDWDGITCDHSTSDVIGLDLSCGMLQGIIHPNTSLFDLPHLQRLNLAYNNLSGSQLPSEIGRFSNTLTHLNISDCEFSGQVPAGITLLHKLVSLDLSSNYGISLGPRVFRSLLQNSSLLRDLRLGDVDIGFGIPTYLNISSSSSLKSLNLWNTGLTGKLPDNIFSLQYLEELDLSMNYNLTGPLPRVNATIPPLKYLDLSDTNLSGEIPDSVGHFKSLTFLDLSYCKFIGPLPESIVNLRHLIYLDLTSNKLNGTLPSSLFSLQSLERLSLYDNQFVGHIDVQTFRQLANLTDLALSYNNFSVNWELDSLLSTLITGLSLSYSGLSVTTSNAKHHVNPNFEFLHLASCKLKVFPESLRSMRNLQELDLSSNEIRGQIPHWVGEIEGSKLIYLDLSHNLLTGLPQFQCYGLEQLYLQSNLFQGPFPPSICNMSDLWYLDLSNNRFDGVIPQCFGNITSSLTLINMGNNRFQGTIPNVYESCGLEWLILNGNQLEGEVPSSLSKCQFLKVLDVGNNHLNGTFPSWLGDLSNLRVLILKSNIFHGPIVPSSTARLPFQTLQVLDLSHNRFVGQLPAKFFQNFNAMKNVVRTSTEPEYLSIRDDIYYSIIVGVKGQELLFPKLFVGYTIVDLSNNTFEGEIPKIIGTLNSLKVLNLSHNNLNGQIPPTFGNLTDIESLDLSWNQLTGEIPRNLTDIKGLEVLNLSQNNLCGRIPQGNQFNTFNETSFEGNLGLCGFPLPKQCNHGSFPQAEGDGDADEENGITWKVVMLGYGCGTLLGLLMGSLMLSTGKPKWFSAIADKGEHVIQIRRNKKRHVYIGK